MRNRIEIKRFRALSLEELYAILELRTRVFVVGQKITAEPEVDGHDPECAHALLWVPGTENTVPGTKYTVPGTENTMPGTVSSQQTGDAPQGPANAKMRLAGTARIFVDRAPIAVGRVAIHPDYQREGLGTLLMREIQASFDGQKATLHAQAHLRDWYERLGWRAEGEVFLEAEIPHISMRFDAR